MKRALVFAHFSNEDSIQDYVVYMLEQLSSHVSYICFVSDTSETSKKTSKILKLCDWYLFEKHGEYDFGSYKRGYNHLMKNINLIDKIDEIIFMNDSCFGPIQKNGFIKLFNTMDLKKCDAWGYFINNYGIIKSNNEYQYIKGIKHIQSYCFSLRKNIFSKNYINHYFESINHQEIKNEIIINYEQGLSKILIENNCLLESYIQFNPNLKYKGSHWKHILEKGGCLIKKSEAKSIIEKYYLLPDYPIKFIKKTLKKSDYIYLYKIFNKLKNKFFSIFY